MYSAQRHWSTTVSNELQAFLRLAQLIDLADTNNGGSSGSASLVIWTGMAARDYIAGLLHHIALCR